MKFVFDPWLSGILEKDSYHLVDIENTRWEDKGLLSESNVFIDAKVLVSEIDKVSILIDLGFRLVDTNVILEHKHLVSTASPEDLVIRFSHTQDEEEVAQIAKVAFTQTRFHLDPKIDVQQANKLKESWARNFYRGLRGDWMLVAEQDCKTVGFLQLIENQQEDQLVIDLIGVEPGYARTGIGREMVDFAMQKCTHNCSKVIVGTQIGNFVSLRFYESLGFKFKSASYVLHYHG